MWLIDISSLQLVHVRNWAEIPDYAILSHVWSTVEISFGQMCEFQGPGLRALREVQPGLAKVVDFCRAADDSGHKYAWIDTCCIDKSNSAELEESIRSMFRWYQRAKECFVYLADVKADHEEADFLGSKWFKRGWTLQELIAPSRVTFYRKNWTPYGRLEHNIAAVSERTLIPESLLGHTSHIRSELSQYSVAQKMSWAASRRTRRIEDEAYCLMGLFDINMPVMYGEGNNAFRRLQKHILEQIDDPTIFAWRSSSSTPEVRGLLADSPREFAKSARYQRRNTGPVRPSMVHQIHAAGIVVRRRWIKLGAEVTQNVLLPDEYLLSIDGVSGGRGFCIKVAVIGAEQIAIRVDAHDIFDNPTTMPQKEKDEYELMYAVPFGRWAILS